YPLESVDFESDDDGDETIQNPSTAVTVKEDIFMIHDLYFSGSAPHPALSSISKKHVDIIREFASNDAPASPSEQRRVRKSVLLAQRQVEREMEQDFEEFGSSELWFRVLEDADFTQQRKAPLPRSESAPGLIRHNASSGSGASLKSASVLPQSPRGPPTNIEVLMSPPVMDSSSSERAPLFDDPDDRVQRAEEQRMEAIQAALTDIIALEDSRPSKSTSGDRISMFLSPRLESRRKRSDGVGEGEDEDAEIEDDAREGGDSRNSFQLAGPGDLQLTYEISRLAGKIVNLEAQETMLGHLIRKAELTGDTQSLGFLNKSRAPWTGVQKAFGSRSCL
ncbi:hypothetical protein MPER_06723, partial [Moniliophthora perniciosa FA553]